MKIAKKFMALALAAVLSVGCAFGVSADGSRTKDVTVVQEDSQVYEIIQKIEDTDGFKELKEAVPAVADTFEKVGKGEMDMNGFADVLKTLAEEETDETLKAAIEEVTEKLDGKDFEDYKIKEITGAKVCKFYEDGVEYETADGQRHESRGYDSVILSMGFRNYNPFGEEIKAIVPDTYVIGDATRARRALDATKEAYEVASAL